MKLVSVVIPSYNRFRYLLNTIDSVKSQTYKNLEIIVVNDCSTEKEYYNYDWEANGVKILHLPKNSKEILGYVSCGYVRNRGIENCKGNYVAICDDDDIWFPEKLVLQLKAMKESGCQMSCTEGLFGYGVYDETQVYKKYNSEHYFKALLAKHENYLTNSITRTLKKVPGLKNLKIFKSKNILKDGFPDIWEIEFLKVHNCVIASSVVMTKKLLDRINNFRDLKTGQEDHDCWLRALEYTNIAYVKEVCFYYDGGHGDGQNY